jgi:competence protein ComEA
VVNINRAFLAKLTSLPIIGPKIGQRIVDFRNKNGFTKKKKDTKKVSGICDKTYEEFNA